MDNVYEELYKFCDCNNYTLEKVLDKSYLVKDYNGAEFIIEWDGSNFVFEKENYKGNKILAGSLSIGDRFYVYNGDWEGTVIEKNGKKHISNLIGEHLIKGDEILYIKMLSDERCSGSMLKSSNSFSDNGNIKKIKLESKLSTVKIPGYSFNSAYAHHKKIVNLLYDVVEDFSRFYPTNISNDSSMISMSNDDKSLYLIITQEDYININSCLLRGNCVGILGVKLGEDKVKLEYFTLQDILSDGEQEIDSYGEFNYNMKFTDNSLIVNETIEVDFED